ncbi:MAG TPA: hypothetical protein VG323_20805 [Thermoanaerobaculia bacterium]|nr:hypothetical protein [Thermoanaerobaculia bacterium]
MKHLLFLTLIAACPAFAADAPSRPPEKGCKWEKFSNTSVGLEAWVQRCDFGDRKIDFIAQGQSLAIRYSDGGKPENVIDVLDRRPGESGEAAVKRIFAAHTEKALAAKCVARPFQGMEARKEVQRFTFVLKNPKAIKETPDDEVPPPPCGEWGASPDGIQYFEVHPSKIFFVRVGQDIPLFDEQTLRSTK